MSLAEKRRSVLSQALDVGLIEHQVFSIYTALDLGKQSSIKFGSYDESAIAPGSQIEYVKTKASNSWELPGYALAIHEDMVQTGPTPKVILIEPQLPYMYVPAEDWPGVRRSAIDAFKGDGVLCQSQYCFFEKRCD